MPKENKLQKEDALVDQMPTAADIWADSEADTWSYIWADIWNFWKSRVYQFSSSSLGT